VNFDAVFTWLQLHEHSNLSVEAQALEAVEEGCFLWETHVNVLARRGVSTPAQAI
jgi:hypothetical protein